MIKHIIKIIGSQRKSNGWIFAELLVVLCAVWWMMDQFYVDMRTYYSPLGYDISNVWSFNLDKLPPGAPGFIPVDEKSTSDGEDLLRLREQIKQHPAVEEVSISYQSIPYSNGSSWASNIQPVDGDTIQDKGRYYKFCRVTPEYFSVFDIKDINGSDIAPMLQGVINPVIVSADMAETLFHTVNAKGQQIKVSMMSEDMMIAAVSRPHRENEYERSEPILYMTFSGDKLLELINAQGMEYADLAVRMKKVMTQEEMNLFLKEMEERLKVNNLNVYSVETVNKSREHKISDDNNELSKKMSLLAFLLVNVFFGILGTFWLRAQQRRGELGLRVALGATRFNIKEYMYMEGTILLLLTLPLSLAFALNMVYLDILDTYRLPYTMGRFVITYGGTYLLMLAMIWFSIWLPVRKAGKMAPAEALHYE